MSKPRRRSPAKHEDPDIPNQNCFFCRTPLSQFLSSYPYPVCRTCEKDAVNAKGQPPHHDTFSDAGDNPLTIRGTQCWRRYRLGGYVTMADPDRLATLEDFYRQHGPFLRKERPPLPPAPKKRNRSPKKK